MKRLLLSVIMAVALPGLAQAATRCADAVQGKIAWNYDGATRWAPRNIERLCAGAGDSVEPARCFETVMHDGIDWGGGTRWQWGNALSLCKGTRDAAATVDCFETQIAAGRPWKQAIETCQWDGLPEGAETAEGDAPATLGGKGLVAPGNVLTVPKAPGTDKAARPAGTENLTVPARGWEGDLRIERVELKGPIARDFRARGTPPTALFNREYSGTVHVRNISARAVRVTPLYTEGDRLRSTAPGVAGEKWAEGSHNVPAGEVTPIPILFDIGDLSDDARHAVLLNERFTTELFLADPHREGDSLDAVIFRDNNMDNHRQEVSIPVIIPYRVRMTVDEVIFRRTCTADGRPGDWILLSYLYRDGMDMPGSASDETALGGATGFRSYSPGAAVTLSPVYSRQDMVVEFAIMPARPDEDGRYTAAATDRFRFPLHEWKGRETLTLDKRLEKFRGCEGGGSDRPVRIKATLHIDGP